MKEEHSMETLGRELRRTRIACVVTSILLVVVMACGLLGGAFLWLTAQQYMTQVEAIAENLGEVDWQTVSEQIAAIDADALNEAIEGLDTRELSEALSNLNGAVDVLRTAGDGLKSILSKFGL